MRLELSKLLIDIQSALMEIQEFTTGMDLSAYRADAKCKAAVERKFEIVGEACTRMRDDFPETFERMASGHQIIGFRNRLIHGYDSVDDGIVWDVLQTKLPDLLKGVEALIESRCLRLIADYGVAADSGGLIADGVNQRSEDGTVEYPAEASSSVVIREIRGEKSEGSTPGDRS